MMYLLVLLSSAQYCHMYVVLRRVYLHCSLELNSKFINMTCLHQVYEISNLKKQIRELEKNRSKQEDETRALKGQWLLLYA